MRIRSIFIFAFLSAIVTLFACQDKVRLELSHRVEVLVKDTMLYDNFMMDFDGISMHKSKYAKRKGKDECKVYYSEIQTFEQLIEEASVEEIMKIYENKQNLFFNPSETNTIVERNADAISSRSDDQPLEGIKIALDPVYIGGSMRMAEIEQKLLKIVNRKGDTVFLDEGLINLETAVIAAIKLQKLGAEILLTRKKVSESAFGKSFFTWLNEDFRTWVKDDYEKGNLTKEKADYLRQKADAIYVYNQYFKPKELKARVERINRFKPDLTLAIGYNIDETNWLLRSSGDVLKPIHENYALVYVPGGFMAGELETPRDRMEFLRLMLTKDYKNSIKFAELLSLQFNYKLGTPPLSSKLDFEYLDENSIKVKEGIYARNLSITRLVHGPVCYGVPLCLDNENEFLAIGKDELKVGKLTTSKRVEQVADAFVEAIKTYFSPDGKISETDLIEREI
ncbi:MAG: hypothetical protein ACI85I_002097 [Arenicella sp.]|jgi:hypothetical protein